VTDAARRVLDATGVGLRWEVHDVGWPALQRTGRPLPPEVVESVRKNGVALKGPVSTPAEAGKFRSVNIALRNALGLFAQIRPCASRPGPHRPMSGVDLVVIRDTTEDLYAGVELPSRSPAAADLLRALAIHRLDRYGEDGQYPIAEDAGFSLKFLSPAACRRIAAFAFDYAQRSGRSRVTAVHKATVMRCTDGLFLEAAAEEAVRHPEIEFDKRLVDNVCGQLVRRASDYDVLLAPNMYGDILADLAAGLVGGVGVVPGANYGPDVAVFEAAHGTAPKHAGANRANPTAAILSGLMLLEHLGERRAAARVAAAVEVVLAEGLVTYDLNPDRSQRAALGTIEFTDEVIARL
jgi:isocitrate dehydrogenase (NAD+)